MGRIMGVSAVDSDFRIRAAALRDAAADPHTDYGLVRFMVDTAADMETVATLEETNPDLTVSPER